MEARADAEFKLHDMLRDGLCGSSVQASVQSPRVPVIVRVTGVFLPVRIAGIFVAVRVAVIRSPIGVAATAGRLWINSTSRERLRVSLPHASPPMHRSSSRKLLLPKRNKGGIRKWIGTLILVISHFR